LHAKSFAEGGFGDRKGGKKITFADLLAVNLIFLDITRQRHAYQRLKARKEEIHLRKAILNARRVMQKIDKVLGE
jgi:hypothetical protein